MAVGRVVRYMSVTHFIGHPIYLRNMGTTNGLLIDMTSAAFAADTAVPRERTGDLGGVGYIKETHLMHFITQG